MTDDMYIKVIPELFTAERGSWRSTCEAMISQIERHVDCVAGCEIVTEEDNGGWISVQNRLPENKTLVLMTMEHDGLRKVEKGLFVNSTWYWKDYPLQYWSVIAWKPLPEPWEGDA